QKFGPGDYKPIVPVAYWGFRWMIGFGMASFSSSIRTLVPVIRTPPSPVRTHPGESVSVT
ncbi:cytochrome ubiquinol oxidase subunit I, partial [Streptomyces flaveolus]